VPASPPDPRFDRQVRFAPLGAHGQSRLERARVLLVGCGALGGSLAQTLVRCGVGQLVLADRDVVELSNLPRQVLFEERQIGLVKMPLDRYVARRALACKPDCTLPRPVFISMVRPCSPVPKPWPIISEGQDIRPVILANGISHMKSQFPKPNEVDTNIGWRLISWNLSLALMTPCFTIMIISR